jgi:hypothetical protein
MLIGLEVVSYDFYVSEVLAVYPHVTADLFASALPLLRNPKVAEVDLSSIADDSFVASAEARKVGE